MDVSKLVQESVRPADAIHSNISSTTHHPPHLNADASQNGPPPASKPNNKSALLSPARTSRTALLLIDIQRGINTNQKGFGTERSTPKFEENISLLLAACRRYNAALTESEEQKGQSDHLLQIIHVFHESSNPLSPLHPSGTIQKDGILFMPCAEPDSSSPNESVFSKTTSSAFVDEKVGALIHKMEIEQLIIAGLVTDHCVNSSTRWARDLGIVKPRNGAEEGRIVLVKDGTGCFAKGGFDAETVHAVALASLRGEFADIMKTGDVLRELFG